MQILRHVRRGEVRCVESDLRAGADVNCRYPGMEYQTLLGCAAVSAAAGVEMIDLLLDQGAEIDSRTSELGCSALHLAAKHGTAAKVRRLAERGASLHKKSAGGYSAILHAAFNPLGDAAAILDFLIGAGVDPHAASEFGESPLAVAAESRRRDLTRILLQAGVEPDSIAWNPLHCEVALGDVAARGRSSRAVDSLDGRDRAGRTPLLLALNFGDAAKAEDLLSRGAVGRAVDVGGRPRLMLAARSGAGNSVAWSLDRLQCDLMGRDRAGYDALSHAVECGAVESARLLLAAGASSTAAGPFGEAPIYLLPFHRGTRASVQLLRLLCEAGANPSVVASTGDHPLRDAAQHGCAEAVKFLLEFGVPANLNSTGETALHVAVAADEDDVVRLLLAAGADPHKEDVDGDRPVDLVRSPEVAKLIGAPPPSG